MILDALKFFILDENQHIKYKIMYYWPIVFKGWELFYFKLSNECKNKTPEFKWKMQKFVVNILMCKYIHIYM